jgi:hypothetical protein
VGASKLAVVRKRTLVLLLAATLVAACGGSGRPEFPSLAEQAKPPYAKGVEVGKKYGYVLLTHCGIVQAQIDGTLWVADPPLVVGGNPPEGWENPMADGTLRLVSKDRAEFVDDDNRATFRRADADPEGCD